MEVSKPHRHTKVRKDRSHADAASSAAAPDPVHTSEREHEHAPEQEHDSDQPPMTVDMTAVLPPAQTKLPSNIIEWVRQTPEQTAKFIEWCDSDVSDQEQAAAVEYATRWDLARMQQDPNYMPRVACVAEAKADSADRVFKTLSVDPVTGVQRRTTWSNLITPVYRINTTVLVYQGNFVLEGVETDQKHTTKNPGDATRGVTMYHRPNDTLLPASLLESQVRAFDAMRTFQMDSLMVLNYPDPVARAAAIDAMLSGASKTDRPVVRVEEDGRMSFRLKSMVAAVHGCKPFAGAKAPHADKVQATLKGFDLAESEWAVLAEDPVFFNKSDDADMPDPIHVIAKHFTSAITTSRRTLTSGKSLPVEKVNGFEHVPVCIVQDGVPVILSQLSLVALQRNYRKFLAWAMIKPPHFVPRVKNNVPLYLARLVLLSNRVKPDGLEPADDVPEEYVY